MRLLNVKDFKLSTFNDDYNTPPYAILSHTWGEEEVTFRDLAELTHSQLVQRKAYSKIEQCCLKAHEWGLEWVWIDTCCIDQQSSAELSEAINSMYQWYQQSSVCYAYLYDTTCSKEDLEDDGSNPEEIMRRRKSFNGSRWFTRGWCLQELLAPRNMQFFNASWDCIGSKHSLKTSISAVTGIDEYGLFIPDLSVLSVAHRMSWAARRETKRAEDIAYCLLGIFNINMPLLYGEGEARAFGRLQEEIMKRTEDDSIFAWSGEGIDFRNDMVGFLAPHPKCFAYGKVSLKELPNLLEPLSTTGRGIRVQVPLVSRGGSQYLVVLGCTSPESMNSYYAIPVVRLKSSSDVYRRQSQELVIIISDEVTSNSTLSTIFLLRYSRPIHLEDTDAMQVWLSLLEMRDCVYSIRLAFPSHLWNTSRRVFAFSPLDFTSYPRMAIVFGSPDGKLFALRIHLGLMTERSASLVAVGNEFYTMGYSLVEQSIFSTDERAFDIDNKPSQITGPDDSVQVSQLVLGQHSITATVEQTLVFGQLLYEVKVMIHKG